MIILPKEMADVHCQISIIHEPFLKKFWALIIIFDMLFISVVRAQDWRPRVIGLNPAGGTSLQNFGNSVYPALPVYFGGNTRSCRSLLFHGYARGSKMSHTGRKCLTCRRLQKSEINHSCVSRRMGCLEYTYLRPISTTLSSIKLQHNVRTLQAAINHRRTFCRFSERW